MSIRALRGCDRYWPLVTGSWPDRATCDGQYGRRTPTRVRGAWAPIEARTLSDPERRRAVSVSDDPDRVGATGCGAHAVAALEIDWFFTDVDLHGWIHIATIPVFTGVIGWLINWTGLIMLFSPVQFHGVTVPGLRQLSRVLPRKVQEVPGLPPGRDRLAGHRAGAGGEDGQHRRGQGDRQARDAGGVLPAARAGPDRRAHRHRLRAGHAEDDRRHHGARAPEPVARPPAPGPAGDHRAGAGPAADRRTRASPTRSACTSTSCSTRR